MATSLEATEEGTDSDTLKGLESAFGELAEGLIEESDAEDADLEAELTDTPEVVEPEKPDQEATEQPEVVVDPDADPLANAKALDYTVDGQSKSYDGIKVLSNPDGSIQGAIIPPDHLKDVQYRLQRGEYLETQNKALYSQVQDLERFTFKAQSDGQEYKGLAGVEQLEIEHAKLQVAAKIMAEALENPDKLVALAFATQNGDQTEIKNLTREIALSARETQIEARQKWGARAQQFTQQATQETERASVTQSAISASVQHWASQFPSLTQDDTQKAVAYFSKLGSAIVRQATPDEAKAAGVKPGELIIDHPVIHEWLSDRAALKSQAVTATADATKRAQQAARENASRLAGAAKGTSQSSKGKPSTATKPKKAAPVDDGEETWSQMRNRLQRGEFMSSEDD